MNIGGRHVVPVRVPIADIGVRRVRYSSVGWTTFLVFGFPSPCVMWSLVLGALRSVSLPLRDVDPILNTSDVIDVRKAVISITRLPACGYQSTEGDVRPIPPCLGQPEPWKVILRFYCRC